MNILEEEVVEMLQTEPGLKAKVLAKKLGKARKELNQYLHSRSDLYRQDDNYGWYLIQNFPHMFILPENIWVDADIFETCLKNCGCLHSSQSSAIIVVIPNDCKILLDAGARLLSLLNQLVYQGKNVTIDFSSSLKTKSYLNRAGFFDLLDDYINVLPQKSKISAAQIYKRNNNSLVEFGVIDPQSQDKTIPKQLKESFVAHSKPQYGIDAYTVFSELFGNVTEHSETGIPGFAALQKYEYPKKHIQAVVSDSGKGISATLKPALKEHYPDLYESLDLNDIQTDIKLIVKAFTEGGLSQFGSDPEVGRGLGLFKSKQSAMKYNAKLYVRQETFSLQLVFKDGEFIKYIENTNLPLLFGTHICFDFLID